MKLVDVKSNTYIDPSKEISNNDPQFEIDDIVRLPKNINIFGKGYIPNFPEKVFVVKRVYNIVLWTWIRN